MEYALRIRSKSIITTFQSGMYIFWGCYWIISILNKIIYSCRIFFRKCKHFPIGFWGEKNMNLVISLENILSPSILCMTVRKGKEGIFFSLSSSLFLISISSSLSAWSSILNSLPLSLVRSFHNSGFDCLLMFFQSLSTITFL